MFSMEDAKVSFFRVERCGYYRHGQKVPDFGSLANTCSQLAVWSRGVDLAMTKLSEPGAGADQQPVYLAGIEQLHGDYVFATWNEVPSHEAGVASISLDSKVGAPKVALNTLPKNSIPGYATYFWVIPSKNLIATIRFGRPVSGQTAMVGYVKRFLEQYSSFAVWKDLNTPNAKVMGFTDLGDGKPKPGLKPAFKTSAFVKTGPRDQIIKNHAAIVKVVRRGHLSTTRQPDRALFQKLVQFVRSEQPTSVAVNQSAYLELEYTPTLEELKAMIKAEEADLESFGWDDLGFAFKGEASKTVWLGRSGAIGDFELGFDRVDEETIVLSSLAKALHDSRAKILKLLE